jgi:hypothetical protein
MTMQRPNVKHRVGCLCPKLGGGKIYNAIPRSYAGGNG